MEQPWFDMFERIADRASSSSIDRSEIDVYFFTYLNFRKTKIKTCYIFRLERANYRQDEDIC